MAFYRVRSRWRQRHRRRPAAAATVDRGAGRRCAVERQSGRTVQQTFDAVADQLGPPPVVQPGVGSSPTSRATRSLRVASRAVSMLLVCGRRG